MKQGFFIGLLLLLLGACSTIKENVKTSASLTQSSKDSTEYEIYIDDLHFEQWYLLNYSEAKDHANDYYRGKNLVAVSNWNDYYRKGRNSIIIDSYINYEPNIDYGIEVNRKLYWYFKYIKDNYGINFFW